jgi:uncharacterized protein (TIGR02996 family)
VTVEEALLQDACAHPDDDTPRLVYADWLEEQYRRRNRVERAEFIRLQIELARMATSDPRRQALEERESKLLNAHSRVWARCLPAWVSGYGFRRGLVDGVSVSDPVGLVLDPESLWRVAPVEGLTVDNVGGDLPELLSCPYLARLSVLVLNRVRLDGAAAQALAVSPHLTNLRYLSLNCEYGSGGGDAAARALAASAHLSRLTRLSLRMTSLGAEGSEALAESSLLARLTDLDLEDNALEDMGAWCLARSSRVPGLANLNLSGNRIGDDGARGLAGSTSLAGLTHLGLSRNQITWAGMEALLTSAHLGRLASLTLEGNRVAGGEPFPAPFGQAHLTSLNLAGNRIGNRGAAVLAAAPCLSRLTDLNLCGNPINSDGARVLAESPYLANTRVDLFGTLAFPDDFVEL